MLLQIKKYFADKTVAPTVNITQYDDDTWDFNMCSKASLVSNS